MSVIIMGFMILLMLGFPIAFVMLAVTIFGSQFIMGTNPTAIIQQAFSGLNSYTILAVPFFIISGSIASNGGTARSLVNVMRKAFGRLPGGLGIAAIMASAFFAAITGSSMACIVAVGALMIPYMLEEGYPSDMAIGVVNSAGSLGILIPPSIPMVTLSVVMGVSVADTFAAGLIPGLLLAGAWAVYVCFTCKKKGIPNAEFRKKTFEYGFKDFVKDLPAVFFPVIILGSIYGGFLTATEAAALSVVYAIPIGIFYYKKINWATYRTAMIDAGKTAGVIMCMMLSVQILSRLYITENLPDLILGVLTSISSNKIVILMMINVFMVIMGMLMDDCSNTTLLTPILLPIMGTLGISVFHFAAILGVNIGMGNITPPTAPLLYLSGRITGAEVKNMLKPTIILILCAWLPTLIVTTYFPGFSEFLPRILGYMS